MTSKKKGNSHLAAKIKRAYKTDKYKLNLAARKLAKTATRTKKKVVELEGTVEDYAIEHPWQTMGMSLLAGIIVGQIFRR